MWELFFSSESFKDKEWAWNDASRWYEHPETKDATIRINLCQPVAGLAHYYYNVYVWIKEEEDV